MSYFVNLTSGKIYIGNAAEHDRIVDMDTIITASNMMRGGPGLTANLSDYIDDLHDVTDGYDELCSELAYLVEDRLGFDLEDYKFLLKE